MRKLTLSIAAATAATASIALAAPGMVHGDMTRAQVQTKATEHFAKMDVNNDGKLDTADREARRAQMFDKFDADGNGAISREEFDAKRGERREHRGMGGHEGMDHEGTAHDGKGKRGMRGHRGGGMHMLKMADANNDGAISQAEFSAGALKMFDMADADNNGTVTQAERKAAHDKMRAEWKAKREAARAN